MNLKERTRILGPTTRMFMFDTVRMICSHFPGTPSVGCPHMGLRIDRNISHMRYHNIMCAHRSQLPLFYPLNVYLTRTRYVLRAYYRQTNLYLDLNPRWIQHPDANVLFALLTLHPSTILEYALHNMYTKMLTFSVP